MTGLPRSGTTHLVNLLASDTRFRSLPLWEADEPVPNRGAGRGPTASILASCAATWSGSGCARRNPFIAAMHPMNPDYVHEDLELWANDFAGYNPEWIFQMMPAWRSTTSRTTRPRTTRT